MTRDTKKKVRFDLKPRVDVKLGGTDPFGAFALPQDKTTDLALHHCKPSSPDECPLIFSKAKSAALEI